MNDGSWRTNKSSICAEAIVKKAYYPKVYYDYDRANAYFVSVEEGVNEEKLTFVDREKWGIVVNNTRNWGTAKNKCAFIGSACKGVVALSSGVFELVADFGAGSKGEQAAFRKVQMVIYLRHEESGKYIGIKSNKRGKRLIPVDKAKAAPFFTSYSRFISFQYPNYHLVDNRLELIREIDLTKAWTLNGCNIYNEASGNSFDQVPHPEKKGAVALGSSKYDPTSTSQKFDVGLSGKWMIRSTELGVAYADRKGIKIFTDDAKASVQRFRWNARQLITVRGRPFNKNMEVQWLSDFKFEDKESVMTPRDCSISLLMAKDLMIEDHNLALEDGKLVMSSNNDSSWTFEYADL